MLTTPPLAARVAGSDLRVQSSAGIARFRRDGQPLHLRQ